MKGHPLNPWTEEDKVNWVEKASQGLFGPHWQSFCEDMQLAVSNNLLLTLKDEQEEVGKPLGKDPHR